MLINFAIQTIRERKFRSLLASFSITIGTASLIVFLGLNSGIKNATFEEIEKTSPLTQITVRPNVEKSGVISFITKSEEGKIKPEDITAISQIPGVKNVYSEIQFNNFSSLEVSIFGENLITDTMIFGVPQNFIKDDLKNPDIWKKTTEPYPAIIPRKILDIYNLTIASPQNLPVLSEENLIGKNLTLYPNYSTFFPISDSKDEQVQLEVVGFSDKVNLIGATIPLNIVELLNEKYATNKANQILELYVESENASETAKIAQEIETLGFSTFYFQKNLQDIEAKFNYLRNSLGVISAIILLTSALAIISTFLATVAERTKEIGLFRALGATKAHIKKIIFFEACIIGIFGSITGTILGILASFLIDKIGLQELAQTSFRPETLFGIDYILILGTITFGTLLSIISAYIPARKAADISPIQALNRL